MTKQITKKEIMQTAWHIARVAAYEFGGKARQYLSGALQMAWDAAKATSVSASGKFLEIASPARFNESFVARMKNTSGATCRKEGGRFIWSISRTARGLEKFLETAAITFGGAYATFATRTLSRALRVAPVNDYNMYHPNGAYYG